MITVKELADELGITPYALGQLVNVTSWADDATVPNQLAEQARNRVEAFIRTHAPEPAPLTLDTYEPSWIVLAAIDALVHVTGSPLGRTGEVAALFMTSAVVVADLVAQGVTPYATAPGVSAEPDRDASNAVITWVAKRANAAASAHVAEMLGLGPDSTVSLTIIDLR